VDPSTIISGIAVLIAVIFGIKQIRLQNRVAKIEEDRRREEVELRRRAELTASIQTEKNSRGTTVYILFIRNLGPAAAREVRFDITAEGGEAPTPIKDLPKYPIPLIDPGPGFRVALQVMMGTALYIDMTLSWVDDEGRKRKDLHLSVF
jgi:hypothetical protein